MVADRLGVTRHACTTRGSAAPAAGEARLTDAYAEGVEQGLFGRWDPVWAANAVLGFLDPTSAAQLCA